MPFKWSHQNQEALEDMLTILDEEIPQPKTDNNLALTLEAGGKVVWHSRAPDDLPLPDQVAHALAALITAGQKLDVQAFLDTMIDHFEGEEGIEILVKALLTMSSVMDGFLVNMEQAAASIMGGGHIQFDRPRFQVENWPPPNRPKIERNEEEPDEQHAETTEPETGTGPEPA